MIHSVVTHEKPPSKRPCKQSSTLTTAPRPLLFMVWEWHVNLKGFLPFRQITWNMVAVFSTLCLMIAVTLDQAVDGNRHSCREAYSSIPLLFSFVVVIVGIFKFYASKNVSVGELLKSVVRPDIAIFYSCTCRRKTVRVPNTVREI